MTVDPNDGASEDNALSKSELSELRSVSVKQEVETDAPRRPRACPAIESDQICLLIREAAHQNPGYALTIPSLESAISSYFLGLESNVGSRFKNPLDINHVLRHNLRYLNAISASDGKWILLNTPLPDPAEVKRVKERALQAQKPANKRLKPAARPAPVEAATVATTASATHVGTEVCTAMRVEARTEKPVLRSSTLKTVKRKMRPPRKASKKPYLGSGIDRGTPASEGEDESPVPTPPTSKQTPSPALAVSPDPIRPAAPNVEALAVDSKEEQERSNIPDWKYLDPFIQAAVSEALHALEVQPAPETMSGATDPNNRGLNLLVQHALSEPVSLLMLAREIAPYFLGLQALFEKRSTLSFAAFPTVLISAIISLGGSYHKAGDRWTLARRAPVNTEMITAVKNGALYLQQSIGKSAKDKWVRRCVRSAEVPQDSEGKNHRLPMHLGNDFILESLGGKVCLAFGKRMYPVGFRVLYLKDGDMRTVYTMEVHYGGSVPQFSCTPRGVEPKHMFDSPKAACVAYGLPLESHWFSHSVTIAILNQQVARCSKRPNDIEPESEEPEVISVSSDSSADAEMGLSPALPLAPTETSEKEIGTGGAAELLSPTPSAAHDSLPFNSLRLLITERLASQPHSEYKLFRQVNLTSRTVDALMQAVAARFEISVGDIADLCLVDSARQILVQIDTDAQVAELAPNTMLALSRK